ncbi:hypothetical protein SXCC_00380 [Gluconacetobacter sp. SXCC-1]|nr:hypothetical protein SXCC_00380 [Gluconacetobacter sp. SXCC-1]
MGFRGSFPVSPVPIHGVPVEGSKNRWLMRLTHDFRVMVC